MKYVDSIKGQRKDFRSKLREYDDGQLDSALSMEASLLKDQNKFMSVHGQTQVNHALTCFRNLTCSLPYK